MPGTAHNSLSSFVYLHDCTWRDQWIHHAILHPDVTVPVTPSDRADQVSKRHTAQLHEEGLNIGRDFGIKH